MCRATTAARSSAGAAGPSRRCGRWPMSAASGKGSRYEVEVPRRLRARRRRSRNTVLVGTILRPHGIKGEVTVALWSDNGRRFAPGVELRATAPRRSGRTRLFRRSGASRASSARRRTRAACGSRSPASPTARPPRACAALELRVPRADVPAAPAGAYYLFELIGCRCFDAARRRARARSSSHPRTAAARCSRSSRRRRSVAGAAVRRGVPGRASTARRGGSTCALPEGLLASVRIQVLTIFPELFGPFLATALVGRAVENGAACASRCTTCATGAPTATAPSTTSRYGGGGGMVMTAPPWLARGARALARTRRPGGCCSRRRAGGWTSAKVRELAGRERPAPALRPLRGDRRARAPDGGRRGDLDRRLRPLRRRAAGDGADRGGVAPGPRGRAARRVGRAGQLPRRAARLSRTTPARPRSKGWRCRRSCSRATMPRSSAGGSARRCAATLEKRPDLLARPSLTPGPAPGARRASGPRSRAAELP